MTQFDVCIISPQHPSLNPRLVKDADALSEAGYSVVVIAPDFSAWGRAADAEFDNRPWKIVQRPKFGPLAPRWTRANELARRFAAGVVINALPFEFPVVVRAAWHPAAPALVKAASGVKARLYLAHLVAALPAAAIAARRHNALYAFDAEDFHLGEAPDEPQYDLQRRLTRAIEQPYIRGCAYVTAASDGIAEAYAGTYGIPLPTTVLNVFPKTHAPTTAQPRGSAEPGPSIYWYSQTIGNDRGLQSLVRAIGKSRHKPHLYLRGHLSECVKNELLQIAKASGVADRVHFLDLALPHTMEILASQYDIGYCGELGQTGNRKIALANKVFTYLLAGIPTLMSDIPAHRSFSEKVEGAVALFKVDDADSLAQAIDAVLGDPARLAEMRATAWQLGQTRYHWDVEKKKVLGQVDRVFKRKESEMAQPSRLSPNPV